MRSPLSANSTPHPGANTTDGSTFLSALRDKARKYHDVVSSPLAELVTPAVEVGGRWNDEAFNVVRQLAAHKATSSPPFLRRSVQLAWADRWWSIPWVAAQNALAASILAAPGPRLVLDGAAAPEPDVDLLLDGQSME